MPIYEFKCTKCGKVSSFLARSAVEEAEPECPQCGHDTMERVFSGFGISGASRKSGAGGIGGALDGMPDLDGLDEEDPRSLGRFLRQAAEEAGEELDPEMAEVCGRLEAGEDPEDIENDMGDVLDDGGGGDELYDL